MLRLATILLIIGGFNWGLVGLFQYDLVAAIFGGSTSVISRIVYSLVGVASIYEIFKYRSIKRADVVEHKTGRDRFDKAA